MHILPRSKSWERKNSNYQIARFVSHPDKVATLGEDIQKAAEEKFKAVSQAYEAICRERGM